MREQEVRELYEAYLQVHQPQEVVEEVEELDENVQDAVKGALEKGANFMKTNPVGKVVSKIVAPAGKGRGTPTATSGGYRPEEVETDLFDTILEHLVSEGYADTNESALVIMANMSEEWRQSILDEGDNYDKNRQSAAKRAAERNAARDAGKTGAVPGVGYVTPRRERETYRDSAGTERHTSGAKMPKKEG
jgi:hypothetical protein